LKRSSSHSGRSHGWWRGEVHHPRAIQLFDQALALARETRDQESEATALGNLGLCYADLGQTHRAIELYDQVLTLLRDAGDRNPESIALNNLGMFYADLGQWQAAVDHLRQAVEIADTIGVAQVQAEARRDLARTQLWAGDLPAAHQTIDTAHAHTYPPARATIALLDGIIHLRQHCATADQAFRDALNHADQRLHHNPHDYDALDTKALALTGLTLCGSTDHTTDAITAFRAARALTAADGIVARIQRQLDTVTPADPACTLDRIRPAASGRGE
jgi:tetratricopeptide (TPR) repeat protein